MAAAGADLALHATLHRAPWWLMPLLPTAVAATAYAVLGRDPQLLALLPRGVGHLAAELTAPRTHPAQPLPRPVIRIADPAWLDARREDISRALTGSWTQTTTWIKGIVVLVVGLVGTALLGTLVAALPHTVHGWNGSGLVAAVGTPIHNLDTHTAGLPVAAATVRLVWIASGAGLLLIAFLTGTFGARLTWVLWGAAAAAMVWAGTPAAGRPVAAALALGGWGIASILAVRGLGRRTAVTHTHINLDND